MSYGGPQYGNSQSGYPQYGPSADSYQTGSYSDVGYDPANSGYAQVSYPAPVNYSYPAGTYSSAPTGSSNPGFGFSLAGLLTSTIGSLLVPLVASILGLIFSIVGYKQARDGGGSTVLALVGIIVGGIILVVTIGVIVVYLSVIIEMLHY